MSFAQARYGTVATTQSGGSGFRGDELMVARMLIAEIIAAMALIGMCVATAHGSSPHALCLERFDANPAAERCTNSQVWRISKVSCEVSARCTYPIQYPQGHAPGLDSSSRREVTRDIGGYVRYDELQQLSVWRPFLSTGC